MPFPDLPPERIPGSPGHLNDHQLIDQALDYIQQSGYRDDPNFPPLPDVPVLGQSGHVTAHDRILAVLQYVRDNAAGAFTWATVSNNPTGTYKGSDGHMYAYFQFTTNGTLTVTTAGLLDVVVVGGGGARSLSRNVNGAGAYVVTGFHNFPAAAHDVTVGQGGVDNGGANLGGRSSIGDVVVTGVAGAGFCSAATSGKQNEPLTVTITGQALKVSGNRVSGSFPGAGGDGDNRSGLGGIVIARTRLN